MLTKICIICYKEKPIVYFDNVKTRLRLICKSCQQEINLKKEKIKNNLNIKGKIYRLKNQKIINHRAKEKRLKEPWFNILNSIKQRCNNPKNKYYKWYGKRGIQNNFKSANDIKFLWFRDKAHLMKKPSIDRIDNDGNYCIENCRFIELSENCRRANEKPIMQFDKHGNFIRQWKSQLIASKTLNICQTSISSALTGKFKSSGGFIWKFI